MRKKYLVILTQAERHELKQLISAGNGPARQLAHARIVLKADQGLTDDAIAEAVEVSRPTVERVRKRFAEEGLAAALNRRPPRREYRRKLDGVQEAQLIALACGESPTGYARWTLRLLADKMVALEYVDRLSHQTVQRVLKKTNSSRG